MLWPHLSIPLWMMFKILVVMVIAQHVLLKQIKEDLMMKADLRKHLHETVYPDRFNKLTLKKQCPDERVSIRGHVTARGEDGKKYIRRNRTAA